MKKIFIIYLMPVLMYCCAPHNMYQTVTVPSQLELPDSPVIFPMFSLETTAGYNYSERVIYHHGAEFICPIFKSMYLEMGDTLFVLDRNNVVYEMYTSNCTKSKGPIGIPGNKILLRLKTQGLSKSKVLVESYTVGSIGG